MFKCDLDISASSSVLEQNLCPLDDTFIRARGFVMNVETFERKPYLFNPNVYLMYLSSLSDSCNLFSQKHEIDRENYRRLTFVVMATGQ